MQMTNQQDCGKPESLHTAHSQQRQQSSLRTEKTFVSRVNRGLIPRTYKDLIQLNKEITDLKMNE